MAERYRYSIEGGIVTHGAAPNKPARMSTAAKGAKKRAGNKPRMTKAIKAAQRPTR